MKRKTFKVRDLVDAVNQRNTLSRNIDPAMRAGWNSLLEKLLHDTGNYRGFGYLDETNVPEGQTPGIRTDANGVKSFPDETRRVYYYR